MWKGKEFVEDSSRYRANLSVVTDSIIFIVVPVKSPALTGFPLPIKTITALLEYQPRDLLRTTTCTHVGALRKARGLEKEQEMCRR